MTINTTSQSNGGSWRSPQPTQQSTGGSWRSAEPQQGYGGKGGKPNSKRARLNSPRLHEDAGKGKSAGWESTMTPPPPPAKPFAVAHPLAGADWRPSVPKIDVKAISGSERTNGTSAPVASFGGDLRSLGMKPVSEVLNRVKQEQPYNNGQTQQGGKGKGEDTKGKGKGEDFKGKGKGEDFQGKGKGEDFKGKGKGEDFKGRGKGEDFKGKGKGEDFKGRGKGEDTKGKGKGKNGKGKDFWDVEEAPQKLESARQTKGGKDGKGKGFGGVPPPPPPPSTGNSLVPSAGANGFQSRTTSTTRQFLTNQRFEDLQIMPQIKRAIKEGMGYEFMTEVQKQTLPTILAGSDVFARAKTGTGKTLGFLIPSVQKIAKLQGGNQPKILGLCLSPTRELAMQIYEECKAITQFIPQFNAQIIYGGTPMQKDYKLFNSRVDLLIATPGRLNDHLENTSNFAQKISSLNTLILDEADQLLEIGFRDAITKIVGYLPTNRQSLLFSATVAQEVRKVAGIALKKDYEFKDCVGDDTEATVQHATQTLLTVEMEDTFSTLCATIQEAMAKRPNDYKIIVFFITARSTQCMAHAFNNYGIEVGDIHSRKSQPQRTKMSDWFRTCQQGILFSSDVSARGMDYPNVTHVIQFGVPAAREQYIHRLGRTARAGTEGEGILMLYPHDSYFLKDIADLPIKKLSKAEMEKRLAPYQAEEKWLKEAMRKVPIETRAQCYSAWLGFYNGLCPKRVRWTKPELVEWANWFATDILLCNQVPSLMKKTVGKMGLKGVPGLVLQ